MKKLLARIKQWNNSNAGLTLVEIIVTMLILVIIALPILGGFIVAGRANAMAKDLAYARDAAENVVEVANSGSLSAEMFNKVGWSCVPSPSPIPTPGVTATPMPGPTATPTPGPPDVYRVDGIQVGTGTYTAIIECKKATYHSANTYDLPDMSVLDAEGTVVIFPESSFYQFKEDGSLEDPTKLHQFDTTAIDDFYNDYYYGVIDIYQNTIYSAYLEEVKRIEKINEANPLVSPTPTPAPPKYVDVFRDKENVEDGLTPLKDFTKRTINIQIKYDKNTEFSDGEGVTVSTEYVYELSKDLCGMSLENMVRKSFEDYDSVIASYADADNINIKLSTAISELVGKTLEKPKSYKVAADITVDTLENIYLVTYPFHAVSGQVSKYNTLSLSLVCDKDNLSNNHLADQNVNVFVTVQDDNYVMDETLDSFDLTISTDGHNGHHDNLLCFYSLMPLSGSHGKKINKTLYNSKENTDGNMLLDVTVKIYNSDNVVDGKELTEVKTTVTTKK